MDTSNIIVSRTHAEWLNSRNGGIGSSEVGTLLGLNPFQTPYQLWLAKTGRIECKEEETFLMKAGHYLEDAISRFYADETGVQIIKNSAMEFVVVDPEKPFMRVSPDRYAWLSSKHTRDNRMIIECKSTQKTVDYDDVPRYWFVQLMYQLGVTRINRGALAWLTQGRDFGYRDFAFDSELFAFIASEVERFWVDCVLGDKEPPLTTVEDVLLRYPKQTVGKSVDASLEVYEKYKELVAVNAEISRLQGIKDEAEKYIKLAIGDAESLCFSGENAKSPRTLATWKAGADREVFDEAAFRAENEALYNKYLVNKAGTRRFMLKK